MTNVGVLVVVLRRPFVNSDAHVTFTLNPSGDFQCSSIFWQILCYVLRRWLLIIIIIMVIRYLQYAMARLAQSRGPHSVPRGVRYSRCNN